MMFWSWWRRWWRGWFFFYKTMRIRMTLRRARRWERGWWWQTWEGAPHRQSEAKTDYHIFYGAGIRFFWSCFFIEFSCSKSATSFRRYCNECNVHSYTFFFSFVTPISQKIFFTQTSYLSFFSTNVLFGLNFFPHESRKLWQNVPKCPKISPKFPKISQHDNFSPQI